jgi:hypothetical protein
MVQFGCRLRTWAEHRVSRKEKVRIGKLGIKRSLHTNPDEIYYLKSPD